MATILTSKPLSFFRPDPSQPRKSFDNDELTALGESLKKKQLVPVLARPDGKIIDGHRRWLAAKLVLKQAKFAGPGGSFGRGR